METLQALFEDYDELSRQNVEMEEYIEELKSQYEEKSKVDDKIFTKEERKIKED